MKRQVAALEFSLPSDRGPIRCRYHGPPMEPHGVVLMVGGTDGGLDGPADRLYPELAGRLLPVGLAALSIDFRFHTAPGVVEEGVFDVERGLDYLRDRNAGPVALMGHSFGGAVVITVAARRPEVAAVVTLSTQSAGTELAPRVAPRPLLLVHGGDDVRLPPICSEYVYHNAREPKQLVIFPGARHSLRQCRDALLELLESWLLERMAAPATRDPRQEAER